MTDTFECSCCKGIYQKGWTDEEAREEYAEFIEKNPEHSQEKTALICENCVPIVDAAAAGAPPEEIQRLVNIRMAEMEIENGLASGGVN